MLWVLLLLAGMPMAMASDQPPEFLSDDAQVACRAILPQCFTRADWWSLCDSDSSIVEAHPLACAAADPTVSMGDDAQGPTEAGSSPAP